MKKILKDWNHLPGIHCGSVAIRDVMGFYELQYSEETCFGLGSGLGFYYSISEDSSPTRSIHLRGPGMEVNFFNHFGMEIEDWSCEDNPDKALEDLIESINNGIPVLIQTDIFYLDYYGSGTHFPGHIVVVCGYDHEKNIFYLSDTSFEDIKEISFKKLSMARNSKIQPYPLNNNNIKVTLDCKSINLKKTAPEAIKKNAELMIKGSENLRGKSGLAVIKSWADDLPNWENLDDWQWASRFAYQVISKRGVDGAGFRWMYRDFLDEMKDICPLISELKLVSHMDKIGREWSTIAKKLKNISEMKSPKNQFVLTSRIANSIFVLESNFFNKVINHFH